MNPTTQGIYELRNETQKSANAAHHAHHVAAEGYAIVRHYQMIHDEAAMRARYTTFQDDWNERISWVPTAGEEARIIANYARHAHEIALRALHDTCALVERHATHAATLTAAMHRAIAEYHRTNESDANEIDEIEEYLTATITARAKAAQHNRETQRLLARAGTLTLATEPIDSAGHSATE